jgi:hypothetical protein
VLISGAFSGRNQFVTMPDGSTHLTQLLDVSQASIALGDEVWTPGPSAHEIFIVNERQSEHVGKVVFRSEDGRPELRLVHTIHMVRLPSGELQVNRQILDVLCVVEVAPNAMRTPISLVCDVTRTTVLRSSQRCEQQREQSECA